MTQKKSRGPQGNAKERASPKMQEGIAEARTKVLEVCYTPPHDGGLTVDGGRL